MKITVKKSESVDQKIPGDLHKEFVKLGRERNKITYKLLSLLREIDELKIYEKKGYANIYEYAARIAGLSPGVVTKTLKVEEKVKDLPYLKEKIKTCGINKVGIVAGLATKENEKDLAEKVTYMSKPALQEYSKEMRGHTTVVWKVDLDKKMMSMLLTLKKKLDGNLSNKECLRRILEEAIENCGGKRGVKKTVKSSVRNCGENVEKDVVIPGEKTFVKALKLQGVSQIPGDRKPEPKKFTRYISAKRRQNLSEYCEHPGCHRPADVIHHPDRFSECHNHNNLKSLCKQHHEFAHNGISEPMHRSDFQYRKHKQRLLK